jgi:hypothetical protein
MHRPSVSRTQAQIRDLALIHEAGHAWLVLTLTARPATITLPCVGDGEDACCEWDAEGVDLTTGVATKLGGLAAELRAGVPEDVARRNAEDDLAALRAGGLDDATIDQLLEVVVAMLDDDAEAFDAFCWRLQGVMGDRRRMMLFPMV